MGRAARSHPPPAPALRPSGAACKGAQPKGAFGCELLLWAGLSDGRLARLDAAKVERIAAAFVDVGLVSIANVLPLEVCDSLREQMDHDSAHMAAQRMWVRAPGHLQQGLPRIGPCVPREGVANPIIEQLAFAILGPCHLSFFNGNSNLPGSSPQILYLEIYHLN